MSINSYNPHTRYKYRAKRRIRMFLVLCFIAGVFIFTGYSLGLFKAKEMEITETMTVEELKNVNEELNIKIARLTSEANLAVTKYKQLEQLYNNELPEEGPLRELVSLLRQQIENGVNPERLEFAIRSARPPTNCTDPQMVRFVVKTPNYKGAKSEVTIGKDNETGVPYVRIYGQGVSAKNKKGKVEAWYDPSKAVKVEFVDVNGKVTVKKRVLPFQHSVVSKGREYRFTLEQGARSFIKVTYDSCDYP